MAIGQNGLQHKESFELDYGSRGVLVVSIRMHSKWVPAYQKRDEVVHEIDLRFPSPAP